MLTPRAEQGREQGDNEKHQEDVEKDLRDAGRRRRNTAEAEERRDERDYEKHQGPVQHGSLLEHPHP